MHVHTTPSSRILALCLGLSLLGLAACSGTSETDEQNSSSEDMSTMDSGNSSDTTADMTTTGPVTDMGLQEVAQDMSSMNEADMNTQDDMNPSGDMGGGSSSSACNIGSIENWDERDAALEEEILRLVNEERAAGATCGSTEMPPVPPLTMDAELRKAARCHSLDVNTTKNLSHTGSDGSSFSERARRTDFMGTPMGENIAAGATNTMVAMTLWMTSEGHCKNIMKANANVIGIGKSGAYWTQVFGRQ